MTNMMMSAYSQVIAMSAKAYQDSLPKARRWVIKFGSSLVTDEGQGVSRERIERWCAEIAAASKQGKEIVVVSSGAVAEGMKRLGLQQRPQALQKLQAAAAIGQAGLIEVYEGALSEQQFHAAMVLLTRQDFDHRQSYLNARSTLLSLVDMPQVIPIVNENDAVATEEICFGDNDLLAAMVANLIDADLLVLMTDQQGMFEADPTIKPDAPMVEIARAQDEALDGYAGVGGRLGRGGMQTKLRSARQAARSGTMTLICDGRQEQSISRITKAPHTGTLLYPDHSKVSARKRWLLGQSECRGRIIVDAGAVKVLKHGGSSLLPIGVKDVEGQFGRGELVGCCDEAGIEIARGLVNYSAEDARLIAGCRSDQLLDRLGYGGTAELLHRDNLALV